MRIHFRMEGGVLEVEETEWFKNFFRVLQRGWEIKHLLRRPPSVERNV